MLGGEEGVQQRRGGRDAGRGELDTWWASSDAPRTVVALEEGASIWLRWRFEPPPRLPSTGAHASPPTLTSLPRNTAEARAAKHPLLNAIGGNQRQLRTSQDCLK